MAQGPVRKGAGQLRHWVTMLSGTPIKDSIGGREIDWKPFTTPIEIPGSVEPQALIIGTEKTTIITIRYRSDVERDPATGRLRDLRAQAAGRLYKVQDVNNPEMRNRDLILTCTEIG